MAERRDTTTAPTPADPARGRAVIVGCGDLGTRIGLRLRRSDIDVEGWRRSPEHLPAGIRGVAADLTRPEHLPVLPEDTGLVIFTPTAGQRSAERYRAVLHGGLTAMLERIAALPARPDATRPRLILISSTAVHGEAEGRIDEDSPLTPSTPTAEVLAQVEELVTHARAAGIAAATLRLTGIYGPGRRRMLERLETFDGTAEARERLGDPLRCSNRIHADDAAAAAVALAETLAEEPDPPQTVIGVDQRPVAVGVVHNWLATQLGRPLPWPELDEAQTHGRRMDGTRLQQLLRSRGAALQHPDFRSGYAAML